MNQRVLRFLFKRNFSKNVFLLKSLVDLTQKMALDDGIQITTKSEDLEHVQTESCLFGQPFPDAKMYPRGPQERHINIPRKLKVEEY